MYRLIPFIALTLVASIGEAAISSSPDPSPAAGLARMLSGETLWELGRDQAQRARPLQLAQPGGPPPGPRGEPPDRPPPGRPGDHPDFRPPPRPAPPPPRRDPPPDPAGIIPHILPLFFPPPRP